MVVAAAIALFGVVPAVPAFAQDAGASPADPAAGGTFSFDVLSRITEAIPYEEECPPDLVPVVLFGVPTCAQEVFLPGDPGGTPALDVPGSAPS